MRAGRDKICSFSLCCTQSKEREENRHQGNESSERFRPFKSQLLFDFSVCCCCWRRCCTKSNILFVVIEYDDGRTEQKSIVVRQACDRLAQIIEQWPQSSLTRFISARRRRRRRLPVNKSAGSSGDFIILPDRSQIRSRSRLLLLSE